jgi:hypothetical protein
MFSFPIFWSHRLFNIHHWDQFSVKNTLYSKRYSEMGLDFGLMATENSCRLGREREYYNNQLQQVGSRLLISYLLLL